MNKKTTDELIDEAGKESFPASDAPVWPSEPDKPYLEKNTEESKEAGHHPRVKQNGMDKEKRDIDQLIDEKKQEAYPANNLSAGKNNTKISRK